jgi:hypothetical protein
MKPLQNAYRFCVNFLPLPIFVRLTAMVLILTRLVLHATSTKRGHAARIAVSGGKRRKGVC